MALLSKSHVAGGHNAPQRGRLTLADEGEPTYGPSDEVDEARMREIGLPFWLAGDGDRPESIDEAKRVGRRRNLRSGRCLRFARNLGSTLPSGREVLAEVRSGTAHVLTDRLASPTGFPLKILQLDGTLSETGVYESRERRCDMGYLREIYRREERNARLPMSRRAAGGLSCARVG